MLRTGNEPGKFGYQGPQDFCPGLPTAEKNGCILPGVWSIAYHKPLSVSGFTTVTWAFTHTVHTPNGSTNRTMYLPKAVQQTPQKFYRRSHKTHLTISLTYNPKKGEKNLSKNLRFLYHSKKEKSQKYSPTEHFKLVFVNSGHR